MGSKIIWKIENFGCLKTEVFLDTPSSFNGRLIINPFTSPECIGIKLRQYCITNRFSNMAIAFLDSEGSPLLWREVKNYPMSDLIKFPNIKRDTIFGSRRAKFLPNDTLRLQFLEWATHEELFNPVSYFYCSRVEPEVVEKTFSWDMADVIKQKKDETREEVALFTKDGVAELMTCGGDELRIQLFLGTSLNVKISKSLGGKAQRVDCIISALDVNEKLIQFEEIENINSSMTEVWTFDMPITKDMLMHYKNELLPNDTLTLVFACTFRTKETSFALCQRDEIFVKNSHTDVTLPLTPAPSTTSDEPENKQQNLPSNTISRSLLGILKEGFMTDFSFRVQDKTFPAHKIILSARSCVFKALFTVNAKEIERDSVDVPGVDKDTFQRMLNFIYADSFEEDMQWESTSKLYAVADTFALEPLKQKCSQQLKSEICASSVLEVLLLGDTHRDDDLKASALDFIAKNDKEIVATDHWRRFAATNILLAFDALQKLYEKKMCI